MEIILTDIDASIYILEDNHDKEELRLLEEYIQYQMYSDYQEWKANKTDDK